MITILKKHGLKQSTSRIKLNNYLLNFLGFDIIKLSEVENQCATTAGLVRDGYSDPE